MLFSQDRFLSKWRQHKKKSDSLLSSAVTAGRPSLRRCRQVSFQRKQKKISRIGWSNMLTALRTRAMQSLSGMMWWRCQSGRTIWNGKTRWRFCCRSLRELRHNILPTTNPSHHKSGLAWKKVILFPLLLIGRLVSLTAIRSWTSWTWCSSVSKVNLMTCSKELQLCRLVRFESCELCRLVGCKLSIFWSCESQAHTPWFERSFGQSIKCQQHIVCAFDGGAPGTPSHCGFCVCLEICFCLKTCFFLEMTCFCSGIV